MRLHINFVKWYNNNNHAVLSLPFVVCWNSALRWLPTAPKQQTSPTYIRFLRKRVRSCIVPYCYLYISSIFHPTQNGGGAITANHCAPSLLYKRICQTQPCAFRVYSNNKLDLTNAWRAGEAIAINVLIT